MKKINFNGSGFKYSVLVLCLTAAVFLGFKSAKTTQTYQNSDKNFDGETIFKGVYFNTGEVASFIPELIDQSEKQKAASPKMQKSINKFIEEIEKVNPQFFNEFKKGMESGDPVQVDQVLAKGSKILSKFVVSNSKTSNLGAGVIIEACLFNNVATYEASNTMLYWVNGAKLAQKGIEREKTVKYLTESLERSI